VHATPSSGSGSGSVRRKGGSPGSASARREPFERRRHRPSAKALEHCQELLGYRFKEPAWLERALTHSSETSDPTASNERLEFLGDAVFGTVVSRWLYDLLPQATEGELTRIKSIVVSRQSLAAVGEQLQVGPCIRVGKGLAGQRLPHSVLANSVEAIIAAVYLDGGLRSAQTFIRRHFHPLLERVLHRGHDRNFKSLLQQVVQAQGLLSPQYRVVGVSGPDHAREFEVEALVDGKPCGRGVGPTKRQAEQRAAEVALKSFGKEALLATELGELDLSTEAGTTDEEAPPQAPPPPARPTPACPPAAKHRARRRSRRN
jgi:ribonuclease-3